MGISADTVCQENSGAWTARKPMRELAGTKSMGRVGPPHSTVNPLDEQISNLIQSNPIQSNAIQSQWSLFLGLLCFVCKEWCTFRQALPNGKEPLGPSNTFAISLSIELYSLSIELYRSRSPNFNGRVDVHEMDGWGERRIEQTSP